jgi:hypothetical protein
MLYLYVMARHIKCFNPKTRKIRRCFGMDRKGKSPTDNQWAAAHHIEEGKSLEGDKKPKKSASDNQWTSTNKN